MSVTNILIGLLPMIGWGVFPVLTGYFGGKPVNQIIGATYGTLLGAIVVALFTQTPLLTGKEFLLHSFPVQHGPLVRSLCFMHLLKWVFQEQCLFQPVSN